jgi:branched-subunit amino acid transport protein
VNDVSFVAALSAVLAVGAITYTSRAGLIVFLADRPLPPNIVRALRYVGPAVLSALTVNLLAGGKGIGGIEMVEIAAVAAAVVVARLTHNLIAALAAGLVTLWVLLAVL